MLPESVEQGKPKDGGEERGRTPAPAAQCNYLRMGHSQNFILGTREKCASWFRKSGFVARRQSFTHISGQ